MYDYGQITIRFPLYVVLLGCCLQSRSIAGTSYLSELNDNKDVWASTMLPFRTTQANKTIHHVDRDNEATGGSVAIIHKQ